MENLIYNGSSSPRSREGKRALSRATFRLILDPFMIRELLLTLTENALGSHPRCVVSVTYRKIFHGGNTGSNPVGDASLETTTSGFSLENS